MACRYGGDEFVIAMPECALPCALRWAETLRVRLVQCTPSLAGQLRPAGTLTLNAGVASLLAGESETLVVQGEALFRAADEALYEAKEQGRNRVSARLAEHDLLPCTQATDVRQGSPVTGE